MKTNQMLLSTSVYNLYYTSICIHDNMNTTPFPPYLKAIKKNQQNYCTFSEIMYEQVLLNIQSDRLIYSADRIHCTPRALSRNWAKCVVCAGEKGTRTERSMVVRVSVRVLQVQ